MLSILQDTSVIKYHHLEQGHGTRLEENTPTADLSSAHMVLSHTGLEEGRSAKSRTSSVPSVRWSPSDVCPVFRRTPHCLSVLWKRSQTCEVPTIHLQGSLGYGLGPVLLQGEGKWKEMAGLLSSFLRGRKPRMMVETVSCSYACVKEISLFPQHRALQR